MAHIAEYPPRHSSQAIDDVIAERQRQISQEGWTIEHDDEHGHGELAAAAATYAYLASLHSDFRKEQIKRFGHSSDGIVALVNHLWPSQWANYWFKPKNRRRDLVKAAALIVAEIERLDREAEAGKTAA